MHELKILHAYHSKCLAISYNQRPQCTLSCVQLIRKFTVPGYPPFLPPDLTCAHGDSCRYHERRSVHSHRPQVLCIVCPRTTFQTLRPVQLAVPDPCYLHKCSRLVCDNLNMFCCHVTADFQTTPSIYL